MRSPPARALPALLALVALVALQGLAVLACARGTSPGTLPDPSAADRQRYAHHQIQSALSFRSQGRLESAEYALDAALAADPENPRALRLMAIVMEDLGRLGAAERHRARADALDPPPPLPPDEPLGLASRGVLVVIPPPEVLRGREPRVAGGWPGGEAVEALLRRLRTRLPDAEVLPVDPANMREVRELMASSAPRAVLSLRIDRAFCGDSEKDGPFSVSWLRVAAATPAGLTAAPDRVRQVEHFPPPRLCVQLPLGRALEAALAQPEVRRALASRGARSRDWPSPVMRSIFPGLSLRIAEHIEQGRARLATGRVSEALASFQAAAVVDPSDKDVHAYVQEAALTLAMARELAGSGGAEPGGHGDLEPQLTAAQRTATERLLAEERGRRDELLAALLVLDSGERAPPPQALENLRSSVVESPGGPGEGLARTLTDAPLVVRAYLGPGGGTIARYWFAAGQATPVLREEDGDGDGTFDRWEGYLGSARRHRWEDRQGLGRPDLHMHFDAEGQVEQIEVDGDGDGRTERLFRYEGGVLASESRDTDDDGHLDRVESFDAEGFVVRREEDLDGDGQPDVKSFYERGALVRREITNPALVEELLGDVR